MDPAVAAALFVRRGGKRQRQQELPPQPCEADVALRAVQSRSHLAQQCLQLWCWGALSASLVQQLTHFAVKDGAQCPALVSLASSGAHRAHPANCQRGLQRLLKQWLPPTVEPVSVELPMKKTVPPQ
jgi:hypothetical protein